MVTKMLIATDGSGYSKKAVDYGVDMAKKLGHEVLALYAVNLKTLEMYALSHHDDITGYETANSTMATEGRAALEYVSSKCKEMNVNFSAVTVRGYPAQEILKLASKEKVSLIVVGNLGKTGLEHLLIGSVSEEVIKRSPCPVLVVRGEL